MKIQYLRALCAERTDRWTDRRTDRQTDTDPTFPLLGLLSEPKRQHLNWVRQNLGQNDVIVVVSAPGQIPLELGFGIGDLHFENLSIYHEEQ